MWCNPCNKPIMQCKCLSRARRLRRWQRAQTRPSKPCLTLLALVSVLTLSLPAFADPTDWLTEPWPPPTNPDPYWKVHAFVRWFIATLPPFPAGWGAGQRGGVDSH